MIYFAQNYLIAVVIIALTPIGIVLGGVGSALSWYQLWNISKLDAFCRVFSAVMIGITVIFFGAHFL